MTTETKQKYTAEWPALPEKLELCNTGPYALYIGTNKHDSICEYKPYLRGCPHYERERVVMAELVRRYNSQPSLLEAAKGTEHDLQELRVGLDGCDIDCDPQLEARLKNLIDGRLNSVRAAISLAEKGQG